MKPITDDQFGHYLAGLIDGDGHFSSKQQLVIVFHSLDASLAYYIKTRIGYGSVKRTKQAVLLIITKCEGLEKIFNLINGKLRTQSKYNVINNYILNVLYFNLLQRKIDFKLNNSNCLNNHWLAGFSDTGAIFKVIGLEIVMKLAFIIKKKNKELLILIKNFLGGNLSYECDSDSYIYNSSSFGSAKKVINYFDKYFLLSIKHIDYIKWRKVYLNIFLAQKNQKRNYSWVSNNKVPEKRLDPNWITGFIDAEGCFSIIILKYPQYKLGWRIKPIFSITINKRDRIILESIQAYFGGVGKIYPQGVNGIQYQVFS